MGTVLKYLVAFTPVVVLEAFDKQINTIFRSQLPILLRTADVERHAEEVELSEI